MSIPIKLERLYRYLLVDVANKLDKEQWTSLEFVYDLSPDVDSRCFILKKLEFQEQFDALNIDGLIGLLRKLGREDIIATTVNEYLEDQAYKDAVSMRDKGVKPKRKRIKKTKEEFREEVLWQPIDEVDKLLAIAHTKLSSLIDKGSAALRECENKAKRYRNGEIHEKELYDAFWKFTELVEKSKHTMQQTLSSSSLGTTSSTSSGPGSIEESTTSREPSPKVLKKSRKPVPKPRQNVPSNSISYSMRTEAEPLTKPVQAGDDNDDLAYEIVAFTGGTGETGDSGLGTGGNNPKDWIKASTLSEQERESTVARRRDKNQYTHLTPLTLRRTSNVVYTDLKRPRSLDGLEQLHINQQTHITNH